jgi:hypothetical protein
MDHEKSTQKIVGYSDAPFVMQLRFELRSLIGLEEPYDHEEGNGEEGIDKEIHDKEIHDKEIHGEEVCRKEGSREKNRSEENSGEEEEFRSKVQSFGRQKC